MRARNLAKSSENNGFGAPKIAGVAQNPNFKLVGACLTPTITYVKPLCMTGTGKSSTGEKTVENRGKPWKTVENRGKPWKTVILAPELAVIAQNSKFGIQNSNIKPRGVSLISTITHAKRLWSSGCRESSHG